MSTAITKLAWIPGILFNETSKSDYKDAGWTFIPCTVITQLVMSFFLGGKFIGWFQSFTAGYKVWLDPPNQSVLGELETSIFKSLILYMIPMVLMARSATDSITLILMSSWRSSTRLTINLVSIAKTTNRNQKRRNASLLPTRWEVIYESRTAHKVSALDFFSFFF